MNVKTPRLPTTKFYISGGRQRTSVFRKLEEWQSSEQAFVIELDPATNQSKACVEYVSPPEACADELPAILFKSSTLRQNNFTPALPPKCSFTKYRRFVSCIIFPCPALTICTTSAPRNAGRYW